MVTWKLVASLAAVLAVVVVTAVLGFTEPRLAPAAVAMAVAGAAGTALLYVRRQGLQLARLERHLERRLKRLNDEHARLQEAIAGVRVECNHLEVLQALEGLRTHVAEALTALGEDESDRLVTAFDLLTARIARLEHALDECPNDLPHPVS